MKYDFSGYATKNDLKCSDGRVIKRDAFKHNDGKKVPLVWQHGHDGPDNILGHAVLENREDGVYAYGIFNKSKAGQEAKELVEHGDITALSIFANQLVEKANNVLHGAIREVSLVISGANPGAFIDNVAIMHSDDTYDIDNTEAIITTGEEIVHGEDITEDEEIAHSNDKTLATIFGTLNEEQKDAVYAMIAAAVDSGVEHGDDDDNNLEHKEDGGSNMKKNIFSDKADNNTNTLSHEQFGVILADATKLGSLKEAILMHAVDYGIEDIDVLFPDAQTLTRDPEWLKREDDWVAGILSAVGKSPFSRIKSVFADMDIDTARAKGYIKATEKKEVYFKAAKRVTTPTTIYVKQKLDRDDIVDVTDMDIVAMVRFQLRTLLDEELAQAILIGDGRAVEDEFKISEENIRPIWTDEDLYSVKEQLTTKTDYKAMIKQIALSHKNYKGSGSPKFYTTPDVHTQMLWVEDTNGRRIYESDATLCAALRVSAIVEIPQFEGKERTVDLDTHELIGMKVNLRDYNVGADKGGQVASFDDFDIDFNQYKYLMETRVSGALKKAKAAQVFEFVTAG